MNQIDGGENQTMQMYYVYANGFMYLCGLDVVNGWYATRFGIGLVKNTSIIS